MNDVSVGEDKDLGDEDGRNSTEEEKKKDCGVWKWNWYYIWFQEAFIFSQLSRF